jgi:hypothetical protein
VLGLLIRIVKDRMTGSVEDHDVDGR